MGKVPARQEKRFPNTEDKFSDSEAKQPTEKKRVIFINVNHDLKKARENF